MNKKKSIILLLITICIIVVFIIINFLINKRNKEIYGDYYSGNEFLRTLDCASVFDSNPSGTRYRIKFELKTRVPGQMMVYQQNGTTCRYTWTPYPIIETTTEYVHYEVIIEPILINKDIENAYLSFYGEYGSGVIPVIRNLSIEPI